MTVGELLVRISSRELTEWMIFYQMEPFGRAADDSAVAINSSLLYNVNRKQNSSPAEPEDFRPHYAIRKEQSMEDMINLVSYTNRAFGGEDHRDG